jgi:DNA-binding transcriptional ArsR family regulator
MLTEVDKPRQAAGSAETQRPAEAGTIGHQVLREAGLIEGDRRGTWIYHRAVPGRLADLSRLLVTPATADA